MRPILFSLSLSLLYTWIWIDIRSPQMEYGFIILNMILGISFFLYAIFAMLFRWITFEYIRHSELLWFIMAQIIFVGVGILPKYMGNDIVKPIISRYAPLASWILCVMLYMFWYTNIHGPHPGQLMDLTSRIVIVTGGNSGIGKETARRLSNEGGATVIIAARNKSTGEDAVKEIRSTTGNDKVYFMELDLCSFTSVRSFASEFITKFQGQLDILIHNAGSMRPTRAVTVDGFEEQLQTNVLAPFLLTMLLFPLLTRSSLPGGARVVSVSSSTSRLPQQFDFDDPNGEVDFNGERFNNSKFGLTRFFFRYGMSKVGLNLWTWEFAKRAEKHGVKAFVLMPGSIMTNITRHYYQWISQGHILITSLHKNVHSGSNTTVFVAASPRVRKSGLFYEHCQPTPYPSGHIEGNRDVESKLLWEYAEKVTGVEAGKVGL
jgi:NAD(P)-dependent dehydrogenase (short-subunit alcohol dehydrogenase family)